MSSLYVVRHGRASFLADDYDRLSPDGREQARLLGEFWHREDVNVSEVYTGTLERQKETAQGAAQSFHAAGRSWPEPVALPGFNEYEADKILAVLGPELAARDPRVRQLREDYDAAPGDTERYRTFRRLLEAVTRAWVLGEYESSGFESWPDFRDRVRDALRSVLEKDGSGRTIAVFTSAGPVGVILQSVLGAPEEKAAEVHWRIYNASVTGFTFTRGRISLDGFNAIGHLEDPRLRTYR